MASPTRDQLIAYARQQAAAYGINPDVFVNQINEESGFQLGLTSSAGAVGIAQFMPSTAAGMGIDPNDPYAALAAAAKLDAQNLATFHGSYPDMLTAYLAGPGSVPSDGSVLPAAQQYVSDILGGGSMTTNPPPSDVTSFPNGPAAPGQSGGIFPSGSTNNPIGGLTPDQIAAILGGSTSPTTTWTDPATGQTYTIGSDTAATVGYDYASLAERTAADNATKAYQDAQAAVAAGDLTLAQQKEADANYWQGVQTQLALGNQANTQQQTQSSYQTAMAGIQQQAQQAAQQYQIGMMNATTDAEKAAVDQQWNQQQALIQQATLALQGTQAQTSQFNAETNRAAQMGNLALNVDQQIDTEATNPRNLMGLYFEQRGITPNWQTIVSGGTPAPLPGGALTPQSPMTAYTPTTAAPTNFNPTFPIVSGGIPISMTPPPMPSVPNYSAQYPLAPAPTVSIPPYTSPSTTATALPGSPAPTAAPGGSTAAGTSWAQNGTAGAPYVAPATGSTTAANNYSGVPNSAVSGLQPGQWDLVTTGMAGPSTVSDYNGFNVALGSNQNSTLAPNYSIAPGTPIWLQKQAHGGYTDAPVIMTGDAPSADPSAGGALPEVVYNPDRARLYVQPNPKTVVAMAEMGIMPRSKTPRFATGTESWQNIMTMLQGMFGGQGTPAQQGGQQTPYQHPAGHYQAYGHLPAYTPPQITPAPWMNFTIPQVAGYSPQYSPPYTASPTTTSALTSAMQNPAQSPYAQYPTSYFGQTTSQAATTGSPYAGVYNTNPYSAVSSPTTAATPFGSSYLSQLQNGSAPTTHTAPLARYALGTDNSQAYANAGMSGDYIQSLANGGVPAGTVLPNNLQALANYGMPLPPALVAANTGNIAPTLNLGAAYGGAGGGVAPSLSTLNAETPGEQGLQQEYTQGVTGIPWDDFVKAISQPTANLMSAPSATGRGF